MQLLLNPSIIVIVSSPTILYMAQRNKPAQIANLLSKNSLVQQRVLKQVQLLNRLNSLFGQTLSGSLSEHCQVASLNNGILVISADSPVWATRLRYEQQQILSQMQSNPEIPPVRKLRIQVRPERGNQNHRVARQATPLSKQSIESLQHAAEEVQTPELKKALQRLALRASRKL